jgi:DNA-binding MarR family transcriptional regulator
MTAHTGTAAPDPTVPAGTQETPVGTPAELAGRLRLAMVELFRRTRNRDWASGLTPSRLSALAIIGADGPVRIGELAGRMAVTTPSVSHIVDALAEQGLIAREHDTHDRRVCLVGISTAGRELLAELRTRTTGLLADQIGLLPEEQQAALAHALPVLEALGRADNLR